ncbi:hypothetical protein GCM10010342_75930 [Streptomyces anulatus]|nr:hypothetical protein GCM10010342_75930 [Streptomyces anulatus]
MPRTRRKRPNKVARVPRSDATLPEFDRGAVPEGLLTRRALREMGLSPGDNEGPVAILRCRLCATRPNWSCRHPTRGFLLRVDLARPKRTPTLAQELALDRAIAASGFVHESRQRLFSSSGGTRIRSRPLFTRTGGTWRRGFPVRTGSGQT